MKMKSKILVILLAFVFGSCEDFLEEKSQSEIRPSTVRDMEKILEGEAYFVAKEGTIFNQGTDIFSDDIQCNMVTEAAAVTQKNKNRYHFIWDKTMFDESGGGLNISFWQVPYERIKGCNVVLEYIDDMEGNVMKKEHLKGEAYTLRGFYYLMLVNFFGMPYNYENPRQQPGVPLKLVSGVTDEKFARNNVAECYDQIVQDLEQGVELMANNREEKSLKLTRMNYLTGYALLSRVYLYMENWDKALAYADSVLSVKSDLVDLGSITDGGVYHSKTPDEILWAGMNENTGSTGVKYPYTVSTDLSTLYSQDVDGGIIDMRGNYNEVDGYMQATISPVFLKRGRQWVNSAYEYWVAFISKGDGAVAGVSGGVCNGGIRTAEIYLNRAEVYCRRYIESGDRADAERALEDLNILREHRFKEGYVNKQLEDFGNGEALLAFCLRERRRELCAEGNHRWFDLRRLGMPKINHVFLDNSNGHETIYTLEEKDSRYVLPIPEEVIRRNPNLNKQ
jgi:hypothetical protein